MEQEGKGRVISSPRVYTSDRHQAKIVKGSQVPYQQSAGDGVQHPHRSSRRLCRST